MKAIGEPFRKAALIIVLLLYFLNVGEFAWGSRTARIIKDKINLRTDATAASTSLGFLIKGEKVNIIEESFDWYKITLPKRFSCYVKAEFVAPVNNNTLKVISSNVNLRADPFLYAAIIGKAERGDIIFFRAKRDGWYEVRGYPYAFGWVNKNFLHETEAIVKQQGLLFALKDSNCEANFVLKTGDKKYFLNILTRGKTKFDHKKVKIEGELLKGSCAYIKVDKLAFVKWH
jgi:uncharacterized protein YgiM (DUF1202 family)